MGLQDPCFCPTFQDIPLRRCVLDYAVGRSECLHCQIGQARACSVGADVIARELAREPARPTPPAPDHASDAIVPLLMERWQKLPLYQQLTVLHRMDLKLRPDWTQHPVVSWFPELIRSLTKDRAAALMSHITRASVDHLARNTPYTPTPRPLSAA